MSICASESKQEKLGTYISQTDLNHILTGSNCSSKIKKSYFIDADEQRINNIMSFADKIANILVESLPLKLVQEVTMLFQQILPTILEEYGERYFTKNHIANHYLALLDYRLSLISSKLSKKDVERVRTLTGLKEGKTFSYFAMKRVQTELLAAGYIKRKRKTILPPLLKTKITQVCTTLIQRLPEYERELHRIQKYAFILVDRHKYPQVDASESVLILISALFPYFFSVTQLNQHLWLAMKNTYNLNLKAFKQRVYRFRCILRKERIFAELFE